MNQREPVLEVEALRFGYPDRPVTSLVAGRFSLAAGESVLLQGDSGSGKSTLLSLIAGVLLPSSGVVRVLGAEWQAMKAIARDRWRADHIGFVFQQFNLLAWLPALDNVELGCAFSSRRARRALESAGSLADAAAHWLDAMQLPRSRWHAPGGQLSIGEQQRVAAARALIGAPELVLADEPTSALDERLRDAFLDALLSACEKAGSALLVVSHDRALEARLPRIERLAALGHA
jgi:putative ABC transport system ATP-binding protein